MPDLYNGYKIPRMNAGSLNESAEVRASISPELNILNKLNATPMHESATNESVVQNPATCTCSKCGATWTPSVAMEDGAHQICPVCGSPLTDPEQPGIGDSQVDPEQKLGSDTDELKLESVMQEYIQLVDAGSLNEAKELLTNNEAQLICESTEEGTDILLEKFVIKVNSEGKKIKKKVRTKKVRRTPAQKQALRKARKLSNKGASKKKRKKAMKARARMGLNESIRKNQICEAVQSLLESAGTTLDRKTLERAVDEAYHMNESEVLLPEDKAISTLETVLNNKGLTLTDHDVEIIDGVLVVHATVQDTDAEIYLGDICDEVEASLEGYSLDYDEPEEGDDNLVDIDFYFIPALVAESADPNCPEDPEQDPQSECTDPKKVNESATPAMHESITPSEVVTQLFESIGGGTDNIRCQINPAFIKPNQVILDTDCGTIFKALSESVLNESGDYQVSIEVCNSHDSALSDLVAGSMVNLEPSGHYFLLRNNPTA